MLTSFPILGAIFDKHYAIAVTPDEHTRDSLAALFPEAESRIFTVQEAKGLEYDVVFTINVTSAYEREWRKILHEKNVKRQRRLRRFFGYIYVAASRARNHLIIAEEKNCSFLEIVSGTHEQLETWDMTRVGLAAQSTADDFFKDAYRLEKAGLTDKAQAARDMAEKIREKEGPKPGALPVTGKAADSPPYKHLGLLTKRLSLVEQDNKRGIINDENNYVIPCEFDSIVHSSHKDDSGRAVFECRRDGKVTYYDQNGYVFKPRAYKPRKYTNIKKTSKRLIALAVTVLFAVIGTSAFFIVKHFQPDKPNPQAILPHEPIADVLEGTIIQVAAGHTHSAALMEDGTVWTWGDNLYEGNTAAYIKDNQGRDVLTTNFRFDTNRPAIKKADIDNVIFIAANNYITAAIKEDNSLWTWGYNMFGALGNGIDFAVPGEEFEIDSTPYKIIEDVQSVSLGDGWGMAVKMDGTLWAWGINRHGILVNGKVEGHSCEPVKIMDDVAAVSAGANHGLALKIDGTVWAWGDNRSKQISHELKTSVVIRSVKVLENAAQIAASDLLSSAIAKDGTAWIWGAPTDGIPTSLERYPFGDSRTIAKVGGGNQMLLMLANDGTLYIKADDDSELSKLTDSAAQVSVYSGHMLVLKEDGSVWALGTNNYSQLGDGTTEKRDELVLIYQNN